jgi:hypothetical protein
MADVDVKHDSNEDNRDSQTKSKDRPMASQTQTVLTDREVRGIRWVFRCSAVRLNGSTVEGYKAGILLGVCSTWEPLGELDDVLGRVSATVAAHGGYCP